jgi:tRNA1(Val) A37 N6-methylase TrmN6
VISTVTTQAISLVKLAHSLIKEKVLSGDIVIDATVGNGHDTLFLLELVEPTGKVFGFDIQETAIHSALAKLQDKPKVESVTLINSSHAEISEKLPLIYRGKIAAVMFNLGYLPKGDKRIITLTSSTLAALACAKGMLQSNGIMTILAYPGHKGGKEETDAVKKWCLTLDPEQFEINRYESQANSPLTPSSLSFVKSAKD